SSGACARGKAIRPPSTIGPSGWRAYSNDVTTPKLPPPPRRPQKSSGFSLLLAVTTRPSAVTIWAESRLSTVKPYVRSVQPLPLPSVRPAIPVVVIRPPVVASPKTWVSRSNSPHVTPPAAHAVRAAGSTNTPFIGVRSITTPSSQVEYPGTLWPPPRTATSRPLSRASATAAITSATPVQRAITAGRRSYMPLNTALAASYSASPGRITGPEKAIPNSATALSSISTWVACIDASLAGD